MLWAAAAGIGFGLFQAFHRRANQLIDAVSATFVLLLIAVTVVGTGSAVTQDTSVIGTAPVWAFLAFALAGIVQFFFGWTLLSLSQQRDGASRTGIAIAATPLIGSIMAAIFLDEPVSAATFVGVILAAAGVALMSQRGGNAASGLGAVPWFGLASAFCWGTAPLLVRWGLEGLDVPLIGVALALASAATAYAVMIALRRHRVHVPRDAYRWIVLSSLLAAGAIAAQWQAWDLIEVTVAITLMQLATPVVVFAAPIVIGTEMERVTPVLVLGMIAVLAGSLLVVWTGRA